eukprot:5920729-Prymnesium_polylepis.1
MARACSCPRLPRPAASEAAVRRTDAVCFPTPRAAVARPRARAPRVASRRRVPVVDRTHRRRRAAARAVRGGSQQHGRRRLGRRGAWVPRAARRGRGRSAAADAVWVRAGACASRRERARRALAQPARFYATRPRRGAEGARGGVHSPIWCGGDGGVRDGVLGAPHGRGVTLTLVSEATRIAMCVLVRLRGCHWRLWERRRPRDQTLVCGRARHGAAGRPASGAAARSGTVSRLKSQLNFV